jgi:prepilin-type processing-associated H-X9-DG protein
MFAINLRTTAALVTDGLSNTFMMGEGAQGKRWPARRLITDMAPAIGQQLNSLEPGEQFPCWGWIFADLNWTDDLFLTGGPFGTTLMPPNQYPVLQTSANYLHAFLGLQPDACNSTVHEHPAGHRMGGFRSAHPGGASFLMADGSVRFVDQSIDAVNYVPQGGSPPKTVLTKGQNPNWTQVGPSGLYQALSTRAGGEAASLP